MSINNYTFILVLALALIVIYQIHKYGLRGYLDQRLERKRRNYDMLFENIHI